MFIIPMKKSTIPFGKNLRRLLDQAGLKYNRAAEKLDLTKNGIGQLMEGEINPSFDTIEKIITRLGFKAADLFSEDSGEASPETLIGDMTAVQFEYYFNTAIQKMQSLKRGEDTIELSMNEKYLIHALRNFGDDTVYHALGFLASAKPEKLKELISQSTFTEQDLKELSSRLEQSEKSFRPNNSSAGKRPDGKVES